MAPDASPNVGLDHVGMFGDDLDTLSQTYERLGFHLTPVSQHARPAAPGHPATLRGTANRCAMFRRGYLELLAVVDPALDTLGVPEALARYAGLHIIAFDVRDPATARRTLAEAGIRFTETSLERHVGTPDGTGRARFTQFKPEAHQYPEGRVFMLHHETRDLVWQTRYLQHPNTATRLKEVIVAVDDANAASERYRRYLGCAALPHAGMRRHPLADGTFFTLTTPQALMATFPMADVAELPRPAAMVVEVADIGTAERFIRAHGIDVERRQDRIIVDPRDAAGVALIFEQTEAPGPLRKP